MTITEIRKDTHVYTWTSHSEGCLICYIRNKSSYSLKFNATDLFKELVAIGSLDDDATPEEFADYNISQWDALNLVIRHELDVEAEKDLDNSDIGKAIENLKNK